MTHPPSRDPRDQAGSRRPRSGWNPCGLRPTIVEAIELACARWGVEILPNADLSACVEPPLEVGLPEVLGPVADIDGLIAEYRSVYVPLAAARTRPMEGARKSLSVLRGAGITVAVATYKRLDTALTILDSTE
jgi:hypothetical protein